ncbi:MAG: FtsW/RodA/SpoVE family cell cycle protein, partial [Oscillibacter sp.]|nr:FtsW/RodA/SpoVE family cell cycle protein [Oscillibacter sp.]
TMSAAASGGLVGMGAGNGWLHRIAAADTDLVFGMLCEEWGLVIALFAVASIVTLAFFTVRILRVGRSSFYTIAACAAGSLMVFQTCLNVFGAVDLLPLTGVTFPFVSNGGSAMMSSWGLLAFLKATDTRENASFAIRRSARRKLREDARQRISSTDHLFEQEDEDEED